MAKAAKKRPREVRAKKPTISKPVAGVVSAAELAAVLSDPPFSDRWLRELADKGYLIKVGRAQYDLNKCVQGYIRFVRETEVEAAKSASDSKEEFERERARKLKLENDQTENKLIETSIACAAVDAVVGVFQNDLQSIPARVTKDVALRRELERECDRVIADINERCRQAVGNLAAGRDPLDDSSEDDA